MVGNSRTAACKEYSHLVAAEDTYMDAEGDSTEAGPDTEEQRVVEFSC